MAKTEALPAIAMAEVSRASFGQRPVVGQHDLQDDALFSDSALIDLLDNFPRQHLYALNMGRDPLRVEENRLALNEGVSGAELLLAVRDGRLWLNLTRVDRADERYRRLVTGLYDALSEQIGGFFVDTSQATLLISSPQALVYYHADGPASVLWHIRGRKRVWVYPALDPQYVKPELLEDIFAGVRHEYLPYETAYDEAALIIDLEPGQWIAWPQNAPHRITNFDSINVSLSTEHFTHASRRRAQLYIANRFLRTRLGWTNLSTRSTGAGAYAKTLTQRVARKLGLDPLHIRQYIPVLRVAADAPGGVVALDNVQPSTEADS